MTGALALTGWGAVSSAGIGIAALAAALARRHLPPAPVDRLYPGQLPGPHGYALVDFNVRELLGRKGTSFLDRATALALVACGEALASAGLPVDDGNRSRIGVALGTTVGSLRSSSDYSRETLQADRPYLVNPVLFPNTVMNCAAGQVAIRYGLRGVNSTVAGGRLGFLAALRYAANALSRGYADAMLVGAVEEFTPHTAWAHHRLGRPGLPGEASVVFLLEPLSRAHRAGRRPLATIGAVAAAYHPGGDRQGMGRGLAACSDRALHRAGRPVESAIYLTTAEPGDGDAGDIEAAALTALGPAASQTLAVREVFGDCGAANGALHLGALLCLPPFGPPDPPAASDAPMTPGAPDPGAPAGGRAAASVPAGACAGPWLLPGWSAEGALAVAVVEGPDVRADRQ